MEANAVIDLRNVSIYHPRDSFREASFRKRKDRCDLILSDVNLTVCPGELIYLIGRVGSGKSSLLKTLYAPALEICNASASCFASITSGMVSNGSLLIKSSFLA